MNIFKIKKNTPYNIDKNIDEFVDESIKYPSKDEYEKEKKRIIQSELNSDRFKRIKEFLNSYNKRKNLKLESCLFGIVGTYGLEDYLINKSFEERKIDKIKRFDKLKKFINSLSEEEIESNIYLKKASEFMTTSIEDCSLIVEELKLKINKLELSDSNQRLELNINIPDERLEALPIRVREYVGIPYYVPSRYKIKYVNVLDNKNAYIYSEYNEYVNKINKLVTDIYALQMWNLLSYYKEEINNYYFVILNNEFEHEFRTAYFVKKRKNEKMNKYCQISEETRGNISKVIGLPFGQIATMEYEELEKYLEQKYNKVEEGPKLIKRKK